MSARLIVDRGEIARFADALFRRASSETWVSLRAFTHGSDRPVGMIKKRDGWRFPCERVGPHLIDRATVQATYAANYREPAVFCPPVATFASADNATAENLAEVLVLSVECDARPNEALASLAAIIGPPTMIMASGSAWTNPETGEIESNAHLHWRLSRAATTTEERAKAHRARRLMRRIVGGDSSAVPAVHPLRWAGSWHRKDPAQPRMARIVALNEIDITLEDALAALEEFVASCGASVDVAPLQIASGLLASSIEDVTMWLVGIPNPHPAIERAESGHTLPARMMNMSKKQRAWEWWNQIGMATWAATAGSAEGLKEFQKWSAKNPRYATREEDDRVAARWRHYGRSPPTKIGAGTLCYFFNEFWCEPGEDYHE